MATTTNVYTPSPGSGVVISPPTTQESPRSKYKLVLYRFGVVEIILGSLSCLLCIVSMLLAATPSSYHRYYNGLTYVATGLWCGVFVIVTGCLGVFTRKNPTLCMYNANMALSIVASVMMGIQIIISSIASLFATASIVAMHSLLALIGFASMVICIIHSAYCCAGVCCRKKHYQSPVMYSAQPTRRFVQLANGQYMIVQNQPIPQTFPAAPFQGGMQVTPLPAHPPNHPSVTGSIAMSLPHTYPVVQGGVTGAPNTSQHMYVQPGANAIPWSEPAGQPLETKPSHPPAYA